MKARQITLALTVLMLLPQALFSQGAGHAMPSPRDPSAPTARPSDTAPMRQMMEMHQKMQAEMQAADGQLDALLAEMNGSTGEKKVEAIAALLNRLVQERKAMQHRMAEMHMQMMGTPGPAGEGTPSAPERMAAREMQQRLAAEREAAEAQMQAERAAMHAQLEAQQKEAAAARDIERAAAEQRVQAERAVAQARQEAERAIAQAREEAAKAAAEREVARKQAEEAIVEARALADRAAAAREEAEKAINEARREAERAAAAQKAAVKQFEADRARREAEKEKK
jgi:hypothetical protein